MSRVTVHLLNSLCNYLSRSNEMITELHTKCQQIPQSSDTKHQKFEVYAMLTIKHNNEEHWTHT